MQLFFCKDITPQGYCNLDAEESRHAVRVLRLREGDEINVTDGCGHLYRCQIVDANDKTCVVNPELLNQLPTTNRPSLHLAVAPTKNPSRMEWLVEKAVEMGVDEITLLQCDHSERSFLKTDRLEKLAVSAMKQSLHLTLPRINPAVPMRTWFNSNNQVFKQSGIKKLIAHCDPVLPRTLLHEALTTGRDTVVLIGPEGDFSNEEIALALDNGFQPVSFGTTRMRTETAALYAVATFNFINEE